MFYSTVYPELKITVFNKTKIKQQGNLVKTPTPWEKLLKPQQSGWFQLTGTPCDFVKRQLAHKLPRCAK